MRLKPIIGEHATLLVLEIVGATKVWVGLPCTTTFVRTGARLVPAVQGAKSGRLFQILDCIIAVSVFTTLAGVAGCLEPGEVGTNATVEARFTSRSNVFFAESTREIPVMRYEPGHGPIFLDNFVFD